MPLPKPRANGGAFSIGRPSISYLYFLLTLTVGSLLIARDWFHPRLELLHQREFVQEEMGFFYHKASAEDSRTMKVQSDGDDGTTSAAEVMQKHGVKFLDLNQAAFVRGPNFEEDGFTLTCPEGQGPLYPRPLSVIVSFPNAGYEWVKGAFEHMEDRIDADVKDEKLLDSNHLVFLKSGGVESLLQATQGRAFRAVAVVRDPRDVTVLTALERLKSRKSWKDSLLGSLLGQTAGSLEGKHAAIDEEIGALHRELDGNLQSSTGLLSTVFDLARFVAQKNMSDSVTFVRYEDMWQRNPKGQWPAIGCWLGLPKHHVDQLRTNQHRLEKEGLFRSGKGLEGHAPGLWRAHFSAENVGEFKKRLGGVVTWLGYQRDESWGTL